jgi:hypothetical protein
MRKNNVTGLTSQFAAFTRVVVQSRNKIAVAPLRHRREALVIELAGKDNAAILSSIPD